MGWMNLHGLKKAHFHYPCSLWDPQKWPWIRGIYRNKIFGHFSYKSNVGKEQWDHKRIGIGSRLHIVWHFSEHGYECSLSFPVIKGKIENLIILLQSIRVKFSHRLSIRYDLFLPCNIGQVSIVVCLTAEDWKDDSLPLNNVKNWNSTASFPSKCA